MAQRGFVQHLSTNGDGTGTATLAGNYASAAETFELADQTGVAETVVTRLIVFVQDTGVFDAEGFGALSVLTNGITLNVTDSSGTEIFDLTPTAITSNSMWGMYAYDVDVKPWGVGDEILLARWTFSKFIPDGLVLTDGEKLVATVNDDLSGLGDFRLTAEGYTSRTY